MNHDLHSELCSAIERAAAALGARPEGQLLERPPEHAGCDFATGLALRLAKQLRRAPAQIAADLAAELAGDGAIEGAEVAGPGFVNLTLTPAARARAAGEALEAGPDFGRQPPSGESFLLEFVSANPTGPLHIGHGRAAAHGDSLARILRHAGAEVATEYYLNDRGLQIDVLAASLWLRIAELREGTAIDPWPEGAYAGEYLIDIARGHLADAPAGPAVDLAGLPEDGDACARELAGRVKAALGEADHRALREHAAAALTEVIRGELASVRVEFDRWQSEAALADSGAIEARLAEFAEAGHTYGRDGAVWFRSSAFGDEKDRVVVRASGEQTYLAADIAYHLDKCARCPGVVYDLLGADHDGYTARLRAILAAAGEDPERLEFGMLQLVALVNAGGRIRMSTRAGRFYPLADLVEAIGADAVRFGFVMSRIDAALEFDVERAASATPDNPIYYVQYAHARSCSLLERWGGDPASLAPPAPESIADAAAAAVLAELNWFAPTLRTAARERAPHRIAHWLIALASALHSYYDKVPVLGGADEGREGRLALVAATRNALALGMDLIGVDAPTRM